MKRIPMLHPASGPLGTSLTTRTQRSKANWGSGRRWRPPRVRAACFFFLEPIRCTHHRVAFHRKRVLECIQNTADRASFMDSRSAHLGQTRQDETRRCFSDLQPYFQRKRRGGEEGVICPPPPPQRKARTQRSKASWGSGRRWRPPRVTAACFHREPMLYPSSGRSSS